MDLINVETVVRPRADADIPAWQAGDAFVSGGTWLFSEAQPRTKRLIDLSQLPWEPIVVGDETIELAANCTYQQLEAYDWSAFPAASLFHQSIRALSSSFKTYGLATVGGNICLAYAKGMMTPVFMTLNAHYELCTPTGGARNVPAEYFQKGVCKTILQPGEYLRRIKIPMTAFEQRCVLKRASYTETSHVIAMVIAALDPIAGMTHLTLSGALAAPVKIYLPQPEQFADEIDGVCAQHPVLADAHASAEYRQALLKLLAAEALEELSHGA